MATTLELQNGCYNGFIQGMGLSAKDFQILQPAPPLPDGDNSSLW